MKLPILVVAGDYRQFVYWCREKGINPNERPAKAIFVDDCRRTWGRRGNPYVTVGTYYARSDIRDIREALHIIEAVPMEDSNG